MVAPAKVMSEDVKRSSHVGMAHRLQTVIRHAIGSTTVVDHLLSASSKMVGHFKHSPVASKQRLGNRTANINPSKQPKCVVQDISARWNSTYSMLHHTLELCTALTIVLS